MRSTSRKKTKEEDEEKKGLRQRTRLHTRPSTSAATASPAVARRVQSSVMREGVPKGNALKADMVKKMTTGGRSNKSVPPRATQSRKPPLATPPPKKAPLKRRTNSPKPLCQRSQQRHAAFRAAFEKMTIEGAEHVQNKKPQTKKQSKPKAASKASDSVPPRLPSVRTSQTPSAVARRPRRRWFPEESTTPEAQFRPRSVREAAAQQKLREQIGANSLKLSPVLGTTPCSAFAFSPLSPEVRRGVDEHHTSHKGPQMSRTRSESLYGQTPPPAEADADSEHALLEDGGWGVHHRYVSEHKHRNSEKQQFRLKSQQLQYQRMCQYDTDHHEVDSPMAIYERAEEELDLA